MTLIGQPRSGQPLLWLIACFMAVQAPAFLVGNVHWDGWIHHLIYLRGQGDWIVGEFLHNGRPINGRLMLAAFDAFGPERGTLLVSFACLLVASVSSYLAGVRSGLLEPAESVLLALFIGCNPADQMMLSSSSLHFFTAYASLCAAACCAVECERRNGPAAAGFEVGAAALAIFGAATGDSVAFLLPGIVVLRLAIWQRARQGATPPVGVWLQRGAGMAVAGAAFVAHFLVFAPGADFEAERQVVLSASGLVELFARFGVAIGVCYALVWAAMLALGLARAGGGAVAWTAHKRLLAFSALLFLLALAPYALADRKPTITGWSVRFLFTMGPALALLCIAWLRAHRATQGPGSARLVVVLVAALLLGYGLRWPLWLERVTKDQAVQALVRTAGLPAQPQTICIFDSNPAVARPYRVFEWTGMVQAATGRSDILALQTADLQQQDAEIASARTMMTERYPLLSKPVPTRCSYELLVPEPQSSWPVTIALAQLFRWTKSLPDYDRWLLSRYPVSGRASSR